MSDKYVKYHVCQADSPKCLTLNGLEYSENSSEHKLRSLATFRCSSWMLKIIGLQGMFSNLVCARKGHDKSKTGSKVICGQSDKRTQMICKTVSSTVTDATGMSAINTN